MAMQPIQLVQYHGRYQKVAARLVGHETARDIAQDTILSMMTLKRELDKPEEALPYGTMTARNKSLDHLKGMKRFVPDAIDSCRAPQTKILERLLCEKALAALGPRERFIVESLYWEGLKPAEIGAELRINVDHVYVLLSRSRSKMRAALC